MNDKTTVIVAAVVVFALVGTLVFAAISPYLSEVDARIKVTGCNENSSDGSDDTPDEERKGCGPNRAIIKPWPTFLFLLLVREQQSHERESVKISQVIHANQVCNFIIYT